MSEPLLIERRGHVAHLRLNRPRVLNAIDRALCDALLAALERIEDDEQTGAIVLSGNGAKAFSAGTDITYMRSLEGAALRRFIERTWVVFERLAASPLPSIAALHGYVLGGGFELALACDLRVADATVQIGLPEMCLGSVPGSGALQRLPALIGPARASELIMLGERIGAVEAAAIGLVNRITDKDQAIDAALAWAATIAERPREALRYAKVALRIGRQPDLAASLHGLVSEACHADKGYRRNTDRFKR
jgi:enoyl-CoA hydratase/carnithine racemase